MATGEQQWTTQDIGMMMKQLLTKVEGMDAKVDASLTAATEAKSASVVANKQAIEAKHEAESITSHLYRMDTKVDASLTVATEAKSTLTAHVKSMMEELSAEVDEMKNIIQEMKQGDTLETERKATEAKREVEAVTTRIDLLSGVVDKMKLTTKQTKNATDLLTSEMDKMKAGAWAPPERKVKQDNTKSKDKKSMFKESTWYAQKGEGSAGETQMLPGIDPHEVGPIKPATDKWDPNVQKYAWDFADGDWKSFYDWLPEKDTPVLHAMDDRAPLTYKAMKEFLIKSELDIPGLQRDDRLTSAIISGAEMAVLHYVYCLRCTFAPLNLMLKPEEFEFEFDDLPAWGIIVMNKDDLKGREEIKATGVAVASARKKNLTNIFQMTVDPKTCGLFTIEPHAGGKPPTGEVLENFWETVKRTDIAVVFHTSGTTKKPKIVPVNHEYQAMAGLCGMATYLMEETDVFVNYMPMFHMGALFENWLTSCFSGVQFVAIRGQYQAHIFYKALLQEPYPTAYSAVPTHNLTLIQHAQEVENMDGKPFKNHIKFIRNDAAALVPTLALRMEEYIDVTVMPGYSMTECNPLTCNPRYGVRKLKSVGPSCAPHVKLLEAWPSNAEIPQGEEGEVCVKGQCIMQGYEMRPHMDKDPNIETFTDGWMRSGDKGWFDADGYLYLIGRFKELINRAGEKISPFLVEDAVRKYEAVKDVLCFAAPHEMLGEVAGVCCTVEDDKELTIGELRAWLMERALLQSMWCPEVLIIMPTLPKGPTGKPARINLAKKLELERLTGALVEFEHPGLVV